MSKPSVRPAPASPKPIEDVYFLPKVSTFKPKPGRLYFDPSSNTLVRWGEEEEKNGEVFQAAVSKAVINGADESF